MAHKGKYARLLVGTSTWASDFSGVSNALELSLSVDELEDTVLQSSAVSTLPGDPSGTITQNGYMQYSASDSTQNLETRLAAAIAAATPLTVVGLWLTDIEACPAYVARNSNAKGMKLGANVKDLITLQGEWPQGSGFVRGKRVWQGTISGTGAQTSPAYIDLGAAGAAGGYAWLFVRTITGTATSASVLLQSDDNTGFSSPATEGTFTFSSEGVVEVALTGAVDRYLRLSTSSLGGATSFVVTAIAAVSGVTY
jgi:hypothetical protein